MFDSIVGHWFLPNIPSLALTTWPLLVLFDINISLGWPNGVKFLFWAVASAGLLRPCYKQVSGGP